MKTLCLTMALGAALCGITPAATIFSLNSSLGTWDTVLVDGSHTAFGLNGVNTNFIQFGQVTPGDPDNPGQLQSGYEYTAAAPPAVDGIPTETQFLLGTFIHHNQAISPGTSILGATLHINLGLAIPGPGASNATPSFAFNFGHDETNNAATPCPYPPPSAPNGVGINDNGCADRVQILNNVPNSAFLIGGTLYTLQILGFSQDDGATFSNNFFTEERANNSAKLYGIITANVQGVPEPGTMLLVCGAGLIGLGRLLRKRTAA